MNVWEAKINGVDYGIGCFYISVEAKNVKK